MLGSLLLLLLLLTFWVVDAFFVAPFPPARRAAVLLLPVAASSPAPPDLAPTPEQLQAHKEEEERDRQVWLEHERRLKGLRTVRVDLKGVSSGGDDESTVVRVLGQLTDLLIEAGAWEVSYATSRATLGGEVIKLHVTVPTGEEEVEEGEEKEEEGLLPPVDDVEGLVRLAVDACAAAAPGAGAMTWTVEDLPLQCGVDWMRAAEEPGFDPVPAGKFHVVPVQRSGLHPLPPSAQHELRILAGEGWGTGQHPTTRLCLEFLSREGVVCGGERVVDYGCGSGILSIAALQLGAREAVGVDIEYESLSSARVNTQLNGVEDEVELLHAREVVPGEFVPGDILLANILVGTLLRMANTLVGAVRPGGWLVLSGLRPEQLDTIKRKYGPYIAFEDGLEAQEEVASSTWGTGAGMWCRLVGRKRDVAGASWVETLSESAVS